MRSIRSIAVLTGLVAGLALTGSADPALARPASQPAARSPLAVRPAKLTGAGFRVAASRHFGQPGNASGYSVIVATGRRQAWAFGGTNPGGISAPVAERWNGSTLTPSRLPAGLRGFINAASAPSGSDVWAASEYGHYVLHWNGTSWRLARRFGAGPITGLTAISAADVWVFGTTASGAVGAGTWRFDGHRWARATGRAATIYRASAVSRRDIWAISAARSAAAVVRFNGRYWRRVPTGRILAGLRLRDILAVSAADVWLLGDRPGTGGVHPVLVHWDGSEWTRITARRDRLAWPAGQGPGWQRARHRHVRGRGRGARADTAGQYARLRPCHRDPITARHRCQRCRARRVTGVVVGGRRRPDPPRRRCGAVGGPADRARLPARRRRLSSSRARPQAAGLTPGRAGTPAPRRPARPQDPRRPSGPRCGADPRSWPSSPPGAE